MKRTLPNIFCLLALAAILAGCQTPPPPETVSPSPEPAPTPTAPPPETLEELLAHLTGEHITNITYDSCTEDELAAMLNRAVEHTVSHSKLTLNGSDTDIVWTEYCYVHSLNGEAYFGSGGLSLYVGLEENLVEVSAEAPLPGGYVFVEDKALYWAIRTQNDRPDNIDLSAYERYQEAVDGYYNESLSSRQEAMEDTLLSWELTDFYLELENEALNAQGYRMDAAIRSDPPETTIHMLVGGAGVDSQLRLLGGINYHRNYLVVIDGQAAGIVFDKHNWVDEGGLEQYETLEELMAFLADQRPGG